MAEDLQLEIKDAFDYFMDEYKKSGTIDGKKMDSKLEARKAAMSKALKKGRHEAKESTKMESREHEMEKEGPTE